LSKRYGGLRHNAKDAFNAPSPSAALGPPAGPSLSGPPQAVA
jgi:hypothetical protein